MFWWNELKKILIIDDLNENNSPHYAIIKTNEAIIACDEKQSWL